MRACDFPMRNLMLAENQEEYETLPVFLETKKIVIPKEPDDISLEIKTKEVAWSMTACFELSDREIDEIIKTRKIWYKQLLFGNNFQPIVMSTENPFITGKEN